jgi:hypothetical protein
MGAGPNTTLNTMSGGDGVRDIDLGSVIKAQVIFPFDPALIKTYRGVYSAQQTNGVMIAGQGGSRMVCFRFRPKLDPACPNVSIFAGFGSPTPTGDQCVYSHPNLPPGLTDGDCGAILGIGADGQALTITTGTITGGNLECNVGYFFIPTAGI